jgi:hypothetical protein
MPFHFTVKPLARLMDRFFHVPFLPLPAGVLALLVPWLWYLALPARMTFVVGDAIDARAILAEAGTEDVQSPTRGELERGARLVRKRMQAALNGAVREHGGRPYDWRSLARGAMDTLRNTPFNWPIKFIRFDRDRVRLPARNRFHAILRDLDLVAFYLPFGWPILSLCRRLRRPPYGYRGLSDAEARERQGAFIWRLADRPLPPRPH